MTGRSKSRSNDLLESWAGTSACDRPRIPPSPETKIKVQMLKMTIVLIFSIIVWRGAGERAQIWEIVADKFQSNHFGWNNSAVNFCYVAS